MKGREGRTKWALRWGLTVGAALLTIVLIAGVFGSFESDLTARPGGGFTYIGTGHGGMWAGGHGVDVRFRPRFISYRFPWDWWPLWSYDHRPMTAGVTVNDGWHFSLTLWPYWLLLVTPTVWLWYPRMRRIPGHCRCGYDLSGLVDAVCPECGSAAPRGGRG